MLIVLKGASGVDLVALLAFDLYLLASALKVLLHVHPHHTGATLRTAELFLGAAIFYMVFERIH